MVQIGELWPWTRATPEDVKTQNMLMDKNGTGKAEPLGGPDWPSRGVDVLEHCLLPD